MNSDYYKNLRAILNAHSKQISFISSISQKNLDAIRKSAYTSYQLQDIYNKTLLKSGYVNVINNTNIHDVFKLNTTQIFNSYNFQINLFSDNAFNEFIKSTKFSSEVVFKAQQIIRNYYVVSAGFSTPFESWDSTAPVKNKTEDRVNKQIEKIFYEFFHNVKKTPINNINNGVKYTSGSVLAIDFENFVTNSINEDDLHLENSILYAVIAFVLFLTTFNIKK